MIAYYNKLNNYFKTAVLSFLLGVVLTLALMFLFFIGWSEIILGLLLGIIFGIIMYVVNGLIESKRVSDHSYRLLVAFIYIRLALVVGFIFGMSALYYWGNVHAFNVIAIAGGYLLVELIFILLHVRNRDAVC